MNQHFQRADMVVRAVKGELERILGQDGEDISCYNPEALDSAILGLIAARSHMAIGRDRDPNFPRSSAP